MQSCLQGGGRLLAAGRLAARCSHVQLNFRVAQPIATGVARFSDLTKVGQSFRRLQCRRWLTSCRVDGQRQAASCWRLAATAQAVA